MKHHSIKTPGTGIQSWFAYMVECSDGTFYTGYTNDVFKRVICHNTMSSGAKYTRSRRPVKLVYYKSYPTKSEAMKAENEIKKLTHDEKAKLWQQK